jgi:hypothetical protein
VEAIGLGIELGIIVPAADRLAGERDHQYDNLYRWPNHTEAADDRARPDITEPSLLTAARLLSAVGPAGGVLRPDHAMVAWLSLEALRIWLERGPGRHRSRPAGPAASPLWLGHYVAETWFEPIESGLHKIRRDREGLVAGGELAMVGYTGHETVYYMLDCAPTFDRFVAEVQAVLAFARRTDSEQAGQVLEGYFCLTVLRGESAERGG